MIGASPDRNVRKSTIAGTWYPGRASELALTIAEFLSHVPSTVIGGRLVALIAPHAGYVYSGQTAAYAYKQLEGLDFDIVVIVSPVHRMSAGPVMVNDCGYYETPLGLVEVDRGLIDALGRQTSHSGRFQTPAGDAKRPGATDQSGVGHRVGGCLAGQAGASGSQHRPVSFSLVRCGYGVR